MLTRGKLKLGYYPLPESEAERMRRFVRFPAEQRHCLDPCSGTGAAFAVLTVCASVHTYGIDLEAYRAAEAREVLYEVRVVRGGQLKFCDFKLDVEDFQLLHGSKPIKLERIPRSSF